MNPEHILVVDDEPEIRRLVQEILVDEGYRVTTAAKASDAAQAVEIEKPDLVLLDIWLPDGDGIALLKDWSTAGSPPFPVVMMSGHGTVETAVEATRLGAYDFIEKPVSMAKLLVTVRRALQAEALRRENLLLRRSQLTASELIGDSPAMTALRDNITRIAATNTWALITGEPGSGKGVAARYLHRISPRGEGPFVEVSLGAIPPENVAVQLFGNERGDEITPGSFEQADGGTLLLDEVGDLDLAAQAQLLNALEAGRFLRVGGNSPVNVDVRIVAATNQDLAAAVKDGRFREDLYYRLNVVPVEMPPLREHAEDISALVTYQLEWLAQNDHLPSRDLEPSAMTALTKYSWPGNVRELNNLLQRLLILNRGGPISAEEVQQALRGVGVNAESIEFPVELFGQPLREARDAFEKSYLENNLRRTNGNITMLAEICGMERTHLYRKLKHLGIMPNRRKEK
jgi:two-component system nitrogen regulation response regulator NtrX